MKGKIIALLALSLVVLISTFSFAVVGVAPSTTWVFQEADGTITFPADTTNGPLLTLKPSANVAMAYDSSGTAAGIAYTVGAYHKSGVKIYGSSSGDAKIYMFDLGTPPGDTAPTTKVPASTTVTVDGSTGWGDGWSALK